MGPSITIRHATEQDSAALARLAALDEGVPPQGETLVALVEGELVAALPMDGARAVADPFQPTLELLALLRVRAGQHRGRTERAGVHWRLLRLARA
jgi:hypothetical protein